MNVVIALIKMIMIVFSSLLQLTPMSRFTGLQRTYKFVYESSKIPMLYGVCDIVNKFYLYDSWKF